MLEVIQDQRVHQAHHVLSEYLEAVYFISPLVLVEVPEYLDDEIVEILLKNGIVDGISK